jgi:hypothetical protein
MTTTIRQAIMTAALGAALALPLAAQAATTTNAGPQSCTLESHLAEQYHAGEYDGTLNLTVYPNGIVQGSYRPSDGGVRTVTGGISGSQIWLEIGMEHPLRLTGTFKGGVLQTVANIPGPDIYTFDATVAPSHH